MYNSIMEFVYNDERLFNATGSIPDPLRLHSENNAI